MQLNQTQMIIIGIAAIAVVAVAAVAVMGLGGNGSNNSGNTANTGEPVFYVDEGFANEATDIVKFYLMSSDGTNKVSVDKAGSYKIPTNPVYRAEVVNESYTLGLFGKQLIAYNPDYPSGAEDYELYYNFNGATCGTPAIEGKTVTIALTTSNAPEISYSTAPVFGNEFIFYVLHVDENKDGITEYYDSKYVYSHTTADCSFAPEKFPPGKAFDHWSYTRDGSSGNVNIGEKSPFAVTLYAILKDA